MKLLRFLWNHQSIQWYLDASAYTGFHNKLAKQITSYLEPDDTLCDIGCGLGRLGLELAPYISNLTAIDIDPRVIAQLQQDAVLKNLKNLHAICMDAITLNKCFDIVLMSFFGKSGSSMETYYQLCRRKLICIVNAANKSNLYPNHYRQTLKDTISSVQKDLADQGRNFKLIINSFEFGQPLRSWQDGEKFIFHHAPKASAEEVSDFLQRNTIATRQDDFPFYLPNMKEIGIFIIDRN